MPQFSIPLLAMPHAPGGPSSPHDRAEGKKDHDDDSDVLVNAESSGVEEQPENRSDH